MFREPHDADTWICRRDDTIRLPFTGSAGQSFGAFVPRGVSLTLERGTLSGAKVHIKSDAGTTQFHVHGTGIIIGRIVNEFGIARRVASAIAKSSLARSS